MRATPAGEKEGVPGWIFVSALLAVAALLAALVGRPLALIVALAGLSVAAAVAGALLRPDRQPTDPADRPHR
ncbi:MAG TPA: hypothetical protein VNT54_19045 [Solirubrobacteraceae bacterium]|nr:hypothetical protein [Solirubrobacteraceae bacterium]